jgi:hypothetical protein
LKLQRLQIKVLRIIGNFARGTQVRDLNVAFKIPHVYDLITKLCRQQAEVTQNDHNPNVGNIGQGELNTENMRGLNLVAVSLTTVQVNKLPLIQDELRQGIICCTSRD